MNDIKLALLGDHEAAKRLTDAGVLVPCALCNGSGVLDSDHIASRFWSLCTVCGMQTEAFEIEEKARLAWNTRAPILSAEEMERLEATNEHDAQRVRG